MLGNKTNHKKGAEQVEIFISFMSFYRTNTKEHIPQSKYKHIYVKILRNY